MSARSEGEVGDPGWVRVGGPCPADDPTAGQTAGGVLLVTADEDLLEALLRVCAAAGVVPDVVAATSGVLPGWRQAAIVLVGGDLAAAVATMRPPRRGNVHVVVTGPAPTLEEEAERSVLRTALAVGAEDVVRLPSSETWLVEVVTDAADGGAGRAVTVGVIGGHGGAGATTMAAALAMTGARRSPTLLLDADPWGPGVDRVVGVDGLDGVRWEGLVSTQGRLGARALRDSLPCRDGLALVTWGAEPAPVPAFVMREVLSAAQRGHGLVVIDLPRAPGEAADDLVGRCDHLVLVTGLSVPAVCSSIRVRQRLRRFASGLHLVARTGTGGVAPDEAARMLGVPLLTAMPRQRGLTESVDLGNGPLPGGRGGLGRGSRDVLDTLVDGARPGRRRAA